MSKEGSARKHCREKLVTFPKTSLFSLCSIIVPLFKAGRTEVPVFLSPISPTGSPVSRGSPKADRVLRIIYPRDTH